MGTGARWAIIEDTGYHCSRKIAACTAARDFSWCPRQELNLYSRLRRPVVYPLTYEGKRRVVYECMLRKTEKVYRILRRTSIHFFHGYALQLSNERCDLQDESRFVALPPMRHGC